MPKFRKKPIIIEAEQYTGKGPRFIDTLEGKMRVDPGDWIITGVANEKYPCKPEIFEKTYEPVDKDATE